MLPHRREYWTSLIKVVLAEIYGVRILAWLPKLIWHFVLLMSQNLTFKINATLNESKVDYDNQFNILISQKWQKLNATGKCSFRWLRLIEHT